MKQIVIEIEDEAYEPFMGMLRLCPAVKVVGTSMVVETRDVIGRCVALAIKKLRKDRVFKHPGDYTYIMRGANEGVIKGMGFFYYPSEFLAYLREIGIDKLPGRNSLYDNIARARISRLVKDHFVEKVGDYVENGTTKAIYQKTGKAMC